MKLFIFSKIGLPENLSKFISYTKSYGLRLSFKKSHEKLRKIGSMRSLHFKKAFSRFIDITPSHDVDTLSYVCNICGKNCVTKISELRREEVSCIHCGSTVRMRAIIHVLSMELFGESLAIQDFPARPDIVGIGMSDWDGYAIPLARKFRYKNTYYHKDPKLDITSIDPALEGMYDFIISSDVFEHVLPPVSIAFENARKLLKPGGVLIFSVPYTKDGTTIEHFPDLHKYEIIKKGDGYILKNITRDGVEQIFDNLFFHGGFGSTLEMRVFSESSLINEFQKAGFDKIKTYREPKYEFGIVWENNWSLPIAARAKEIT